MSTASDIVTVVTSDGQEFCVFKNVAKMNKVIGNLIEDMGDMAIPVPNVTGPIFEKIMEWCENYEHVDINKDGTFERNADFDKRFLDECLKTNNPHKTIDDDYLIELLKAANFLENTAFLDLCATRIADMIKGKTLNEIRKENGISLTNRVSEKGQEPIVGEDGLMQIAFTLEEEEEMMKIKPYEEWAKELEDEKQKDNN